MRALALGLLLLAPLSACSGGDSEDTPAQRVPADVSSSATAPATAAAPETATGTLRVQEYDVPAGSRRHDVAVADDGIVWYTAQGSGASGTTVGRQFQRVRPGLGFATPRLRAVASASPR